MRRSALLAAALSLAAFVRVDPACGSPPPSAAGATPEAGRETRRDPVEGLWLGLAGSEREKVEVGLDFRRDGEGKLRLFLTQPVSNYFAAPLGGEVKREGNEVRLDEMALSLRLEGGRLTGTYPGPNSPAHFERAESLPRAAPIPDVPAGPEPLWQTRLNGQIFASPAVYDGKVYLGTTGGVFNALDAKDGRILWSFEAGRPVFGAALVTADSVYFACDNGYLFRLARADGKEVWRYDLGDSRTSRLLAHPEVFAWDWHGPTPVLAGGLVFAGSGDGSIHAVEAAEGKRRWRFETGDRVRGGVAVAGDRLVAGSADHHLYALDRASGKLLWKKDTGAAIEDAPLVAGDRVFAGNRGGGLYAYALATGEPLWKTFFWGSWVESTPVLADGLLYVGSSDLRRVSAIRPEDGRVLWRTDVYGWTFGTPLVAGDRIYAASAGGAPYFIPHVAAFSVLDRATGKTLRRYALPEVPGAHQWGSAGSPALAGDRVVISTIQGGVMAFPLR